jgi:hypothetical protein
MVLKSFGRQPGYPLVFLTPTKLLELRDTASIPAAGTFYFNSQFNL